MEIKKREVVLYTVYPRVPERLRPLEKMANNLWYCWNLEALDLFRSMDLTLWEETRHNPYAMLSRLDQGRLEELTKDEGFLMEMNRIFEEFQAYLGEKRAYEFGLQTPLDFTVAYFSAEYGLTDCLPIYSGGLGVLSGDHIKSASDLRIRLVGMGLLYQKGYFRQYLNSDGWQLETYPDNDFHILPTQLEREQGGDFLTVEVPIKDRQVKVRVWRVNVGRTPLFMLDTNTVENRVEDRDITSSLYGGDMEMRLKQEIVLGIGGVRALKRLGLNASVFHMNEGHSAFAIVERIRSLMEENRLSFQEAREAVLSNSIFTTHTPVPAGIDCFDRILLASILGDYIRLLGIPFDTFYSMGTSAHQEGGGPFNMAVFALKHTARANGVSRLHQAVSRRMWRGLWPHVAEMDIPLDSVTNGIHIPSWISNDMAKLLDRYMGPRWSEDPDHAKIWDRIHRIPDLELWRTHERRRERLVAFARRRLQDQISQRGGARMDAQMASEVLHPQALTIGFARRFATYKRGDLILRDPARLARLLGDPERPVQMIFAGKAHPKDHPGKEVIKKIVHLIQQPEFRHRVVFIEDYDLNVARYLVQGVDVWLNNPLRPLEACGTSGMKAAANGALNLSVLDGWWDEGYQPGLGWAIGGGEEYENRDYQDDVESQAIYHLLEKSVIPLFYERGRDNLPREWIAMMKKSMQVLAARFNSHRMVQDYVHQFYLPLALQWRRIEKDGFRGVQAMTDWMGTIRSEWPSVRILDIQTGKQRNIELGSDLPVEVTLALGKLTPRDVSVDLYFGSVDSKAHFLDRSTLPLQTFRREGEKTVYQGAIPCRTVGRFGFRLRVLPFHPLLSNPMSMGLILWGGEV